MKKLKNFVYGILFLFPFIPVILANISQVVFNYDSLGAQTGEIINLILESTFVESIYNTLYQVPLFQELADFGIYGDAFVSYLSYCVLVLFIISIVELIFLFINAFKFRKGEKF